MTDPALAARAAALARRSGSRPAPGTKKRRRHHAAANSRILAAGLSASALFGLVGAMNLTSHAATASATKTVGSSAVVPAARTPTPAATPVNPPAATPATESVAATATPAVPAPIARPAPVTTTKSS